MANIVEDFESEDMQYQDYWGSSHDYPEGEYLEDGYYGEEFQETANDPQAEESDRGPSFARDFAASRRRERAECHDG